MAKPESWGRARQEVLDYCRRLQAEHLGYSTAGNISCRVAEEPDLFAVTPTNFPYDALELDDICIATTGGEVVDGRRKPTSEFPMHTLIYARRPEVGAVIHTHSPAAMVMAVMGWTLPPILTGFVEASGGDVVTAPYSRPATAEMADLTAEACETAACASCGTTGCSRSALTSRTRSSRRPSPRARRWCTSALVSSGSRCRFCLNPRWRGSATTGSRSGLIESRPGCWSEHAALVRAF